MTKFKVGDRIKLTYTDLWDNSVITKVVEGSEFQYTFTKPNGISGAEREEYLELAEPSKETYEVNRWYGWNGEGCPVDEETLVEVVCSSSEDAYRGGPQEAGICYWGGASDIVAFRIVPQEKPHVFVGWGDGVFWHKEEYFSGATHKLYEDMTLEEIDD